MRVDADDNYFYLSGNDHQEKWAWITAIEKTIDFLRNPHASDSKYLVR